MEDYKKKYEQARERARDMLSYKEVRREDIEYLFPELKEDEDEKIRREIIRIVDGYFPDKASTQRAKYIAWLEKQGKEDYALKSFKDEDVHKFMQYIEKEAKAYEFNLPNRGYDIYAFAKDILVSLERQGEKKPVIEGTFVNIDEVREDFMQEVYRVLDADPTNDRANQIIDAFDHLPTIIIQEPADKVEPKFKVGDWVVLNENHNSIYQVEKIESYHYVLRHIFGGIFRIPFDSENSMRLWTLQDAKPRDVLAFDDNNIVMFKNLYNETTFHSYCHIEDGLFDVNRNEMPDWWEGKGFHPATKQQRELLFRKIKEYDYEWDEDRKELKKL